MDEEQVPQERPFARACLTALQMIAMGLCLMIVANMLTDANKAPVEQCPLREDPAAGTAG